MEERVVGNAKSLFVTPAEMIVGKPLDTPPFGELPKPNFTKLGLGQTAPSASISLANFHLLVMSLKAIPHYNKKIEIKAMKKPFAKKGFILDECLDEYVLVFSSL